MALSTVVSAPTVRRGLLTLAVLVAAGSTAFAQGKIVVGNDEWTLSDGGFSAPNAPGVYAVNVAKFFSGNTGSFLAYSSNFGLTGASLANALTGAGYTWTVSTAGPFTLANLQNFNGVFLSGSAPGLDTTVLTQYVQGGGNVYLEGGTGFFGGAAGEAAEWNPFLEAFGLQFAPAYNGINASVPISSSSPLFQNVPSLYENSGQDISLFGSVPGAQVLVTQNNDGLYAAYAAPAGAAPEPGTLALALVAAGALPLRLRRRKLA